MTQTYAANIYSLDGHNRGVVIVGAFNEGDAREQMEHIRFRAGLGAPMPWRDDELLQLGEICAYPDGLTAGDTGTLDDGTVVLMARE